MDASYVCETRTQDPSKMIHLISPSQYGEFSLRVSGDSMTRSPGLAVVGSRVETSLVDWILVDSWLCAVRLNGVVRTKRNSETRRCLSLISAYAPTDSSSDEVKDEFYRKLSSLLLEAKLLDMIVVAGGFNAQVGRLNQAEKHSDGTFGIPTERTDNGDHLL
ncbi:unnamed protein product [Heterobilharzia americana]|nr:unnamed protein product [Heterobilharzia americana]